MLVRTYFQGTKLGTKMFSLRVPRYLRGTTNGKRRRPAVEGVIRERPTERRASLAGHIFSVNPHKSSRKCGNVVIVRWRKQKNPSRVIQHTERFQHGYEHRRVTCPFGTVQFGGKDPQIQRCRWLCWYEFPGPWRLGSNDGAYDSLHRAGLLGQDAANRKRRESRKSRQMLFVRWVPFQSHSTKQIGEVEVLYRGVVMIEKQHNYVSMYVCTLPSIENPIFSAFFSAP